MRQSSLRATPPVRSQSPLYLWTYRSKTVSQSRVICSRPCRLRLDEGHLSNTTWVPEGGDCWLMCYYCWLVMHGRITLSPGAHNVFSHTWSAFPVVLVVYTLQKQCVLTSLFHRRLDRKEVSQVCLVREGDWLRAWKMVCDYRYDCIVT